MSGIHWEKGDLVVYKSRGAGWRRATITWRAGRGDRARYGALTEDGATIGGAPAKTFKRDLTALDVATLRFVASCHEDAGIAAGDAFNRGVDASEKRLTQLVEQQRLHFAECRRLRSLATRIERRRARGDRHG